jgi:hypothetical protein
MEIDNDPVGVKPKKKRGGDTRKGKTIAVEKVGGVEDWAKYFRRGYQNIVLGEDGSFLVLDAALTKTDYFAALAEPAKTIRHLMGSDYRVVLANSGAPSELRAAAEAKRTEVVEDLETSAAAARVLFIDAERELLDLTRLWESAPDGPTRTIQAQRVSAANRAVMDAEKQLREALAPHRYIVRYSEPSNIYRLVPESTIAPERVVVVGGTNNSSRNSPASNNY